MDNTENQNIQTDNIKTENTQAENTQTDNATVVDSQNPTPQMSMADQMVARNKQLQTSEIPSQLGFTKNITINAGTKYEYTLTIQYPGIGVASKIEDDSTNPNGSVRFSDLMQGAVDGDVFVNPHIKSVAFWDSHKGYGEVAGEVLSFLNDGIDSNLE